MNKLHNPTEIFGFPPSNKTKKANKIRTAYWCPFTEQRCAKVSRLLDHPFGICSVWHTGTPRIICPNRFYFSKNELLRRVASDFIGFDEIHLVPEVELSGFGDVDWVAYKFEKNEIMDFCGMEIMADSTTQTGELVKAWKDFFSRNLSDRYGYGMNTYNTIKLSFTQILNKGQVFEHWKKYYVWILQDVLFSNLVERFGLGISKGVRKGKWIIFATVTMERKGNTYVVKPNEMFSSSINELLKAYNRVDIPSIEGFIEIIKRKANLNKF